MTTLKRCQLGGKKFCPICSAIAGCDGFDENLKIEDLIEDKKNKETTTIQ